MTTIKKGKLHKIILGLIITIGILLMIFMISVEGEPGAIPLLLIVTGIGWYFITR